MATEPSGTKNNEHWGDEETKFFISMWRQDEILRKIQDKGTRKKKVYQQMSQMMKEAGFNR